MVPGLASCVAQTQKKRKTKRATPQGYPDERGAVMTEQAKIDAKIKQALENPEEPVRRLLTALYESNNFVSRSDLEEAVGYGSGYIGSIKTKITRALAKVPGEPTYADYLFHLNGAGALRLRPDLWNVVGEILGKRDGDESNSCVG